MGYWWWVLFLGGQKIYRNAFMVYVTNIWGLVVRHFHMWFCISCWASNIVYDYVLLSMMCVCGVYPIMLSDIIQFRSCDVWGGEGHNTETARHCHPNLLRVSSSTIVHRFLRQVRTITGIESILFRSNKLELLLWRELGYVRGTKIILIEEIDFIFVFLYLILFAGIYLSKNALNYFNENFVLYV